MKRLLSLNVCVLFLFGSPLIFAQKNEGGQPISFYTDELFATFQHVSLPPPDVERLLQEDQEWDDHFRAERFAKLVVVDLNPLNSGTLEILPDGQKVWRLKLSLEGSLASSLYFTDFSLPGGVNLFIYNENKGELLGAFTDKNNRESGLFATELIYDETVVLELNIPGIAEVANWFTISEITYSYNHIVNHALNKGFGGSGPCEVNINCSPEGDDWQDEKRGVVRIQVKVSGSGFWCTGSMINNARFDNTPYLLTADHCAFKFGHYASMDFHS